MLTFKSVACYFFIYSPDVSSGSYYPDFDMLRAQVLHRGLIGNWSITRRTISQEEHTSDVKSRR